MCYCEVETDLSEPDISSHDLLSLMLLTHINMQKNIIKFVR